jgi:hypothetical protein
MVVLSYTYVTDASPAGNSQVGQTVGITLGVCLPVLVVLVVLVIYQRRLLVSAQNSRGESAFRVIASN